MTRLLIFFFILVCSSNNAFTQRFDETFGLIQTKNFFKAKSQYLENKSNYSESEGQIVEAFIFNAFNDPLKSNTIIDKLLKSKVPLADSLALNLYHLKTDNLIKLYKYKEAKNCIEHILKEYNTLLSEHEIDDLKNSLKIWTAFQHEPMQEVVLNSPKPMKMKVDKAGLKNLPIRTASDTVDFIFDTGANISTVVRKTAEKLKMKILPVDIEVGTITGQKANAQLAICSNLFLGEIEIRNALFLVFSDESLYIPEIDYQINGILGFPIIEALREVTISQDDYFTVTANKLKNENHSNMALDGLTPLIYIDGKHYTFDTGADETILYTTFYTAHKEEIDKNYTPEKFGFAGAGGKREFEGYKITHDFEVNDVKVTLKDVQLLTEKLKPDEVVYGNIGQDIIQHFNSMTISFEKMVIKFE